MQSSTNPFRWRCRGCGRILTEPRAAFEIDDPTAHRAVFGINHILPLEAVLAGDAHPPPRSADERADDVIPAADPLTFQFAVDHVALFVGPDASALHAVARIGEADRAGLESDR